MILIVSVKTVIQMSHQLTKAGIPIPEVIEKLVTALLPFLAVWLWIKLIPLSLGFLMCEMRMEAIPTS